MRKRKTVCGHKINDKISAVNLKVTKEGTKKLADIFGGKAEEKPKEEKKEEKKPEAKAKKPKEEKKSEEKPKAENKEEKK